MKQKKSTEKQINQMRKLREKGLPYHKIGKIFGRDGSSVNYYLNEEYRTGLIERSKKLSKSLTKKQMRERNEKFRNKYPDYYRERYHNDEEFRKSMIEANTKLHNKRKKQGLCPDCGNKLSKKNKLGKKYISCKKCRRRDRDKYKKQK